MRTKIWIILLLLLSVSLAGCTKNEPSGSNKEAITEIPNSDTTPVPTNNAAVESNNPEDMISSADQLLQKKIFEDSDPATEDMGTYSKTLGGYVIDDVDYNGTKVRAVELFWQCENGKSLDYASWFDKAQWAVLAYYNGRELLGFDAFPCEYSMVTAAAASTKLMSKEEGVKLLYDTYMDEDYSSLVSREEYSAKWKELTSELGNYIEVKSLFYNYNTTYSYPYITVSTKFEKGDLYYTYYFKPGTIKIFNVEAGKNNVSTQIVSKAGLTPAPVDQIWLDELGKFSNSSFDLTAALTSPSLKELCSDYFKLGVGIYGSAINNCAIKSPEYMAVAKKHFNSATLTNLMKPSYMLNQSQSMQNAAKGIEDPALSFNTIDETLQWCKDNDVQLRGHTLVWHAQTPDWFFKEGYKSNGNLVDRETMLYRLESYIKQMMTHVQDNYPGVVYCWDVVNEAVEPSADGDANSFFHCRKTLGDGKPNLWYQVLGQDYVEMAFTYARKYADKDVALIYNDYGTFDPNKLQYIYALADYLKSKGLIDGIGMQGYWGISSPGLGTLKTAINKYAELGLQIQITELSISADNTTEEAFNAQGIRYASIMRLLQSLDTAGGGKADITAVTFFGLMDGYMLYDNDTNTSRLFDSKLQPKPAFNQILDTFRIFY